MKKTAEVWRKRGWLMRASYLFTSESVSEGHPDKVCDRISDEIVDLFFREGPKAGIDPWAIRAACETLATTNKVVIADGPFMFDPNLMGWEIAPDAFRQVMIDCQASAVVTPSSYVLACADGGISLQGLTWSSWDAATANASGQISINDCTPNCADGTFRSYPATASVTGLVPYGSGYRYTSLTVSSPGTAKFASDTWPLGLNGP